jgi:UDP-glucuronate 4-epimerase
MDYGTESYAVMNVESGQPVELNDMIDALEDVLGQTLKRNHLPEQPGDVPQTWADIGQAKNSLDYEPQVSLREGIRKFLTSMEVTK